MSSVRIASILPTRAIPFQSLLRYVHPKTILMRSLRQGTLVWGGAIVEAIVHPNSYSPNRPVCDEVRRIRVHQQNNQTGVVNRHQITNMLLLRHLSTFALHTPCRPGHTTTMWAWRRGLIKTIVNLETVPYSARYVV